MIEKIPVVLYCTENYLEGSLNLIRSLNLYHNDLTFYLYTVNFLYKPTIENVNSVFITEEQIDSNIQFKGTRNDIGNTNVYKAIFLKSRIILHSLETLKLNNTIYLDSDLLPTGNISNLYQYFDKITHYPLIQQGIYEYQIAFGRGNPFHNGGFDETNILEYPLMKKHFINIQNRKPYSVASVMLYNQNCIQFIREYNWLNNLAFDMTRDEIEYFYPFCDETSVNTLLWKYQYNDRLPLMQMNISKIENVLEYFESNYNEELEVEPFVFVPKNSERKRFIFFHGIKGKMSDDTFMFQQNMFKYRLDNNENKLYISSNVNFSRDLEINIFDNDQKTYSLITTINKGIEYWISTSKQFLDYKKLIVKIYDDGKLIFKI